MSLLLASTFQHFKGLDRFHDFLSTAKVACITTAALTQIDDNPNRPDWVVGEVEAVKNLSSEFFEYDLRGKNGDDLNRDLSSCDLIYFTGGNTYCLLDAVNESGFREFAPAFLKDENLFGAVVQVRLSIVLTSIISAQWMNPRNQILKIIKAWT